MRKLQRQVDALEAQVTTLGEQKAALEAEMSKPEVFSDRDQLAKIQVQFGTVSDDLDQAEAAGKKQQLNLRPFPNPKSDHS